MTEQEKAEYIEYVNYLANNLSKPEVAKVAMDILIESRICNGNGDLSERLIESSSKRTPEQKSALLKKAKVLDENGNFCEGYFSDETIENGRNLVSLMKTILS